MSNRENILFQQGEELYFKGESKQALEKYEAVLKINSKYFGAHVRIAGIYAKAGNFDDALSQLKKAQAISSTVYDVNFEFGQVYAMNGNFDEAEKYLHRAIMIDPKESHAIDKLAVICRRTKEFDLLRNTMEFVIDSNPNNAEHLYLYGACLMQSFFYDDDKAKNKAISILEKSYSLGCKKKELLFYLAAAFKELGQLETSNKYFDELDQVAQEDKTLDLLF
jgi:tetratricopeptide (TPR) repeat protein